MASAVTETGATTGADGDSEPSATADTPANTPAPSRARQELLYILEVAGLCGLAFTRPILDSYGNAPEAFMARDASQLDVVLFALVVAIVPTVAVGLVIATTNLAGMTVRRWVQVGVVGLLGGTVAWRFGVDMSDLGDRSLLAVAVVAAGALGLARWRLPPLSSFLRFLGGASVLFLVLFLVASPAADLALRGSSSAAASDEHTAAVLEQTDGDPPPVVLLVVDGLPTSMLMDGEGGIDDSLYPNMARLAGDSTWYRNYSAMHAWTFQALPLMFTGQLPGPDELPDAHTFPDNLYSLFAGTHDFQVVEQISRLCSTAVCPRTSGSALPHLLDDARAWWRDGTDPNHEGGQILPGALDPDRGGEFLDWIDEQDFSAGGGTGNDADDRADRENAARPGFWGYHVILPHEPWDLLADGTRYLDHSEEEYGLLLHTEWQNVGAEVGHQRQVLQMMALDSMIGRLLDDLEAAGTYDDALVAVVGDHGQAFVPEQPLRGVSEAQYEQVMWTPLIVKAPGQSDGVVDDTNIESIDLTPLLADTMGIELPWETEGLTPDQAREQRGGGDDEGVKRIVHTERHELEPDDDGFITVPAQEGLERVRRSQAVDRPGEGEAAVWQRTEHGELHGRPLSELNVADGDPHGTVEVVALDQLTGQASDDTLLLELIGHTDLDVDDVAVIVVNDQVAAVVPAAPSLDYTIDIDNNELDHFDPGDETTLHALLDPATFSQADADNTVAAYLLSGDPGDETLHPLELTAR